MNFDESLTVWDRLRQYASSQSGSFTSQEALSWLRRHAPSQANDRTVRTHIRGACWNVGDRSQFSRKEPYLTRIDRGLFRLATPGEITNWRATISEEGVASGRLRLEDHEPTSAAGVNSIPIVSSSDAEPKETIESSSEWHTEANVQALLVTALAADGWRILSVANTATKEHGVDVIASKGDQTVGVEVKGFPSRNYADLKRAAEVKRTRPSTQAGHWFAQAVLAAMRLRGKEPMWSSVIALPDFPRYRALHSETVDSLAAAGIEVWWVDQTGAVHRS